MAGVFTIPAGLAFADLVARHILEVHARPDPLGLSRVSILVPSRRAVAALRDAFLRAGDGQIMVLPAIRSIADGAGEMPGLAGLAASQFDADDPVAAMAAEPLERQLHLARLICNSAAAQTSGDEIDLARAFLLAGDLGELIDELHTEGIDPQALRDAAPEEFAERWQVAMGLVSVAIKDWPAEKVRLNLSDPAEDRDRLLRAYAAALTAAPPSSPVIVAGSTGSIPAAAELLTVIAKLPAGMVILPGLDQSLDRASWQAVGPEHPQAAMKRLLDTHMKIERAEVALWPGIPPQDNLSARRELVSDLMRPAATTERWMADKADRHPLAESALDGITLVELPGQREEAQTIALALREVLETPGRTGALVTPDRALAVRVAGALRRWDIRIDDSGGCPLARTPRGAFVLLLAEAAGSAYAPVPLLSVLKHPMAAGGQAPADFRRRTRNLERVILRGPRPAGGLEGLLSALAAKAEREGANKARLAAIEDARALVTDLSALLAPLSGLVTGRECTLSEGLSGLAEAAGNLAATPEEPGAGRIWAGQDGTAAFTLLETLSGQSADLAVAPGGVVQILRAAMAGTSVRAVYDRHPRIHIWGTPEARMQHTDLVILGGLNEGVWPALPKIDLWLNRPMRARAGLTSPERRIGLSAHDFAQALAAPQVLLTRSRKIDGAPQIAARWLFRLESLVAGKFGGNALARLKFSPLPAWAEALDCPDGSPSPAPRPRPTPPVAARPQQLSVTRIETWIRDPYALYAREILRLRPLDPIDQDPSFLERGIIVHKVFERFVAATRAGFPPAGEAEYLLTGILEEELAGISDFPAAQAFWRERALRAGGWFIEFEAGRRAEHQPLALEAKARLVLETEAGPFTLTATADRIDQGPDGLEILDYKTGGAPSAKEVRAGFAPQLPLEAVMLAAGGFDDIAPSPIGALAYIELTGGREPGKYKAIAPPGDVAKIMADAKAGLIARIEQFADETTPYPSRLYPRTTNQAGDYDHLARVREWSLSGAGEDGE